MAGVSPVNHGVRKRQRRRDAATDRHFIARAPTYILGISREEVSMTSLEVVFSYTSIPDETTMRAIDDVREVYGIRAIRFAEKERTVRVEYNATRLNESNVARLLRGAGVDISGKIALV